MSNDNDHDNEGTATGSIQSPRPSRKRALIIGAASVLAVGALVAGTWGANAVLGASGNSVVQQQLDELVDSGFPAALATLTEPDGTHDDFVSGVGNIETGEDVPIDGEIRLASNTKTFTAVVVLQLAEEGLIELDSAIETYLPGLVQAEGIDGALITVRQLLQHTSGLPNYSAQIATDIESLQHAYSSPRDLIDLAFLGAPSFAPGGSWEYSNTNYVLLGLLIERITERPIFEAITERIIEPLSLEHTYFPNVGEQGFRGDHVSGYHLNAEGEQIDVSELDPSWGWAAGQMIGTTSELNEFTQAILDGRLLGDEMLAEMKTTVPVDDPLWGPGSGYGLGIQSYPLSCGGEIWGHGGDIHGFETRNGVAEDGTAFGVVVTSLPWGIPGTDLEDQDGLLEIYKSVTEVVDAALCDK